ncbi:MAG TPA: sulfur carrier protein ThiS [Nitrospiraceae bacterium]|jgi:thiamine biosynthesis protein ThiS|nr:sulfur carrier protein ThiS [Nitrospiraceae bacterium]
MNIQVNGESRGIHAGQTIAALLRELDIRTDRVAVELNLEILDKKDFETRSLCDGDRVEILSFIGGGAG